MTKKIKMAIISDLHYGHGGEVNLDGSDISEFTLARVIQRLNRLIKPDISLFLGDIVHAEHNAAKCLQAVQAELSKLESPYIIIPGNHDPEPEQFYNYFERPADIVEFKGFRFLPFIDKEEPEFNASRSIQDIERFAHARNDFSGHIIALQHVCLYPPGKFDSHYNYTNSAQIVDAMQESNVLLSISGHVHSGYSDYSYGASTFCTAPALSNEPFCFQLINIDGDTVTSHVEQLANPKELELFDYHIHTPMAYCNDNMTLVSTMLLAQKFNLTGFGFSEHSGHLLFSPENYPYMWERGMGGTVQEDNRTVEYINLVKQFATEQIFIGAEIDCDYEGLPIINHYLNKHIDFKLAAIHRLKSIMEKRSETEIIADFLNTLKKALTDNYNILAHPFRVLHHAKVTVPHAAMKEVATLLRVTNTAAEINFHTNEPQVEFVKMCLNDGIKLALGSDSHSLYEIGDFALHLDLIKQSGFDGNLKDVLCTPFV
jgi:histidinol phosphatase-like PHP family hydrolase/calcineurin-like phosphoesterase family protein